MARASRRSRGPQDVELSIVVSAEGTVTLKEAQKLKEIKPRAADRIKERSLSLCAVTKGRKIKVFLTH